MKLLNKNNFKLISVCTVLLFFGAVLIIYPDRYVKVCFDGICLWAECVLPSLFPFMVITLLLSKLGAVQFAAKPFKKPAKIFKLPSTAAPLFLMSLFSGYPAGSRILSEYYENGCLSKADCKKLAPLCSACGPLFALGTVGVKAFGGGSAGIKLFTACLISVVVSSLIASLFSKHTDGGKQPELKRDGNLLYSAFHGGVTASIVAGGFICFFYTLSQVFADFGIFKPLEALLSSVFGDGIAAGLCQGIIEATGGCFTLAAAGGNFSIPFCGFLMTFGGVSILFQQLCYLLKCGVSASRFIGFKLLQGAISFGLLCLFGLFWF